MVIPIFLAIFTLFQCSGGSSCCFFTKGICIFWAPKSPWSTSYHLRNSRKIPSRTLPSFPRSSTTTSSEADAELLGLCTCDWQTSHLHCSTVRGSSKALVYDNWLDTPILAWKLVCISKNKHNIGWPQLFVRRSLGITLAKFKGAKVWSQKLSDLASLFGVKSHLQQLLGKMQVNEPTVSKSHVYPKVVSLLPNMGFITIWSSGFRFSKSSEANLSKTSNLHHWVLAGSTPEPHRSH